MGITWIRNSVVIDRPAEENDSGTASDGRQYLPYASKTYKQDGSADVVTGRAFNSAIELPPSGSYTQVLGAPKTTEASENPIVASARQAQAVTDAAMHMVQDARDQELQRTINQQAQNDAAVASATNLVQTSGVPGIYNGSWVVKPTKS